MQPGRNVRGFADRIMRVLDTSHDPPLPVYADRKSAEAATLHRTPIETKCVVPRPTARGLGACDGRDGTHTHTLPGFECFGAMRRGAARPIRQVTWGGGSPSPLFTTPPARPARLRADGPVNGRKGLPPPDRSFTHSFFFRHNAAHSIRICGSASVGYIRFDPIRLISCSSSSITTTTTETRQ
jgi:hypothetical protein